MDPQAPLENSNWPRVVKPTKEDFEWAAKENIKTQAAIDAKMRAERNGKYLKTREFARRAYEELLTTREGKSHRALIVMITIKRSLRDDKILFHDDTDASGEAMS